MQQSEPPPPRPRSASAERAFVEHARAMMSLDPASRWVGGYVDYEWDHLRPLLDAYRIPVAGRRVLEFGCNVGASAIVLAWLGARVQAVDIAKSMVDLAEANARRYGETSGDGIAIGEGRAAFAHVADSRALPFPDACFDLVTCNSVLEYVHPDQLRAIQQEIDRVVAPGGLILVTGTSSRLWPREAHSGRWFIHWLPRRVGPLLGRGRNIEYGVWPWMVRYGFGPDYDNLDASDKAAAYLAARAAMRPPRTGAGYRLLAAAARLLGVGPGLLGNSIFCLLLKRG